MGKVNQEKGDNGVQKKGGREGTWEKLEAEFYHWTSKKARGQVKVGEG